MLPPQQLASVEAEEEELLWSMGDFNSRSYAFIIFVTDAYFELQNCEPYGQEDWVGIITEVRQR